MILPFNPLSATHPDLAKEWHPTKNGDLKPSDVSFGMNRKVWWKCTTDDRHDWQSSPNSRAIKGTGCSYCSGKLVNETNSLAALRPDLAKEWHPTLNGPLTPEKVTVGSKRTVEWICSKNANHSWPSTIVNRTRKQSNGCPVCAMKKLADDHSNSLEHLYPDLAKYWHPFKNGNLKSSDVVGGGTKIYQWKCIACGYEYENSIHGITRNQRNEYKGFGCSVCHGNGVTPENSLAKTYPLIAAEWHPIKNELIPDDVKPFSNKVVWWQCKLGHEWKTRISDRTAMEYKCPYCGKTLQSYQELVVKFELKSIWPDLSGKGKVIDKTVEKKKFATKYWFVDIYIPEINLIIEFDGNYAHASDKKNEVDLFKGKDLLDQGYSIMRIREHPLPKINQELDIIFKLNNRKFDGKQVTDSCLGKILDQFKSCLSSETIQKIEVYLSKKDIQNKVEMETYLIKYLKDRKTSNQLHQLNIPAKIFYRDFEGAREFARSKHRKFNLNSEELTKVLTIFHNS